MKAGDKFKNIVSGNEGTVVAINPDNTVDLVYNSAPYVGDDRQVHTVHVDGIEIIPGFSPRFSKQHDHDISNETLSNLAHHPMFPPGTRVIDKDGDVGTVTSRVFESDGPCVEIELDGYQYCGPFDTDLDDLTLVDLSSQITWGNWLYPDQASDDTDTGVNKPHSISKGQIDKGQEQITARTNQLLNELYHDRARLEKVVNDGVQVIDTLLKVTENTRIGAAQDDTGELSDEEYIAWAYGLGQQFVDTHGDGE